MGAHLQGFNERSSCSSVGRAGRLPITKWFDPQLHQSTCQSVLVQDTEPQIAPDAVLLVCKCVSVGRVGRLPIAMLLVCFPAPVCVCVCVCVCVVAF